MFLIARSLALRILDVDLTTSGFQAPSTFVS